MERNTKIKPQCCITGSQSWKYCHIISHVASSCGRQTSNHNVTMTPFRWILDKCLFVFLSVLARKTHHAKELPLDLWVFMRTYELRVKQHFTLKELSPVVKSHAKTYSLYLLSLWLPAHYGGSFPYVGLKCGLVPGSETTAAHDLKPPVAALHHPLMLHTGVHSESHRPIEASFPSSRTAQFSLVWHTWEQLAHDRQTFPLASLPLPAGQGNLTAPAT